MPKRKQAILIHPPATLDDLCKTLGISKTRRKRLEALITTGERLILIPRHTYKRQLSADVQAVLRRG